jgi:hypothetical protein
MRKYVTRGSHPTLQARLAVTLTDQVGAALSSGSGVASLD